ncbi:DNRLRE domain-containing protein [Nannocystis sp. RBIL2]|uniref:DNRLRE domain-containing protein n=1 Tax=Nannocystis sp. RBIL2 TaxID=2996788 RepID=UPI00226F5921|nr:DNRLRE domain-containing protein [Nannocystis sp. RBIL2]MCY1070383.1 DNRLRE domain-containing protein [Nannocystis sp. RBIL2]
MSTVATFVTGACDGPDAVDAGAPAAADVMAETAQTDLEADEPPAEGPPPFPQALLVSPAAAWTYLVQPAEGSGDECRVPAGGDDWRNLVGFDDSDDAGWAEGLAELGYGDGDERTVIPFGDDPDAKCITQYFRHEFTVTDPTLYASLVVRMIRDDGAAVYLNGTRVVRSNLPVVFGPDTVAQTTVEGSDEDRFFQFSGISNLLVAGANLIAVEVHQRSDSNPDVSFALELAAALAPPAVGVDRSTVSFASIEATIDESSRNTNFGTHAQCRIDGASGEDNSSTLEQVCLARWDVAAIPAGAIVRAAHLDTNVTNSTPDRYGLHVLTTEWTEAGVTWEDRNGAAATDWQTPGGVVGGEFGADDFEDAPLTVVNALATGERIVTLPPELVADWRAAPASNFGLAFLDFANENGLDFSTAGAGIELVVTYDVP